MPLIKCLRTFGLTVLMAVGLAACAVNEPEATKLYGRVSQALPAYSIAGYKYASIFRYRDVKATHKQVITLTNPSFTQDLSVDEFLAMFQKFEREAYELALSVCPTGTRQIVNYILYQEVTNEKTGTLLYSCNNGCAGSQCSSPRVDLNTGKPSCQSHTPQSRLEFGR